MALLGGRKYARDLAQAKTTFLARARRHAHDIAPGVEIKVAFEPIAMGFEAESFYFPDKSAMLFIVDDLWFEANMYNIDSRMIDGIQVHELCHLKLDILDYSAGLVTMEDLMQRPPQHHGTKRFRDCVIDSHVPKRFTRAMSDPGYTSFRHYLGSKEGAVPPDIFFIYEIYCPTCKREFYLNLLALLYDTTPRMFDEGRERTFVQYIYNPNEVLKVAHCDECGGPIERVRHLTPVEVYADDNEQRGQLSHDLIKFG